MKNIKTIGIIAPAGPTTEHALQPAIQLLEENDFKPVFGQHVFKKYRYFSGTAEQRLSDLNHFLEDDSIDLMYAARGGFGSAHLLPEINFDFWQNTRKPLVGFSDVTVLQWQLAARNIPTISGMTLTSQLNTNNPFTESFFNYLKGTSVQFNPQSFEVFGIKVEKSGSAEAPLIGGTLSMILTLLGTVYYPKFKNYLLFLEEINEPFYKIERALLQLKQADFFKGCQGIVLGKFLEKNKSHSIYEDLKKLLPQNVPILSNFPYGHYPNSAFLPLGPVAKIDTNSQSLEITGWMRDS